MNTRPLVSNSEEEILNNEDLELLPDLIDSNTSESDSKVSNGEESQNTPSNEGNYHSIFFKTFVLNYFKEVFHLLTQVY